MINFLSRLSEQINNNYFDWIGITFIFVYLILTFGIGFINGTKVTSIFLIGNTIGLISGVIFITYGIDDFMKMLFDYDKSIAGSLKIRDIAERGIDYAKSLFGGIIILFFMIVSGLVTFITYLFLRKRVKLKIFTNKAKHISNTKTRIFGGVINSLIQIPFLFAIGIYLSSLGSLSSINTFYSGGIRTISADQIKDTHFNIMEFANSAKSIKVLSSKTDDIAAILGSRVTGSLDTIKNTFTDSLTRGAIDQLLHSHLLSDNFDLVAKMAPISQVQNINLTATSGGIDWMNKVPNDFSIHLEDTKFINITDSISKYINSLGIKSAKATPEGVRYFLTTINAIMPIK